jgi:5-methylcytosine-specific restriction endonuclease McrA
MKGRRRYLTNQRKRNCEVCGVGNNEYYPIALDRPNHLVLGLSVHHIIPVSRGGTDEPANLKTVCERCHKEEHRVDGKINYEKAKKGTE